MVDDMQELSDSGRVPSVADRRAERHDIQCGSVQQGVGCQRRFNPLKGRVKIRQGASAERMSVGSRTVSYDL